MIYSKNFIILWSICASLLSTGNTLPVKLPSVPLEIHPSTFLRNSENFTTSLPSNNSEVPEPVNIRQFACMKIAGLVELSLPPDSSNKQLVEMVPSNAIVSGQCELRDLKLLQLTWNSNASSGNPSDSQNTLQFYFVATKYTYSLYLIKFKQPQSNLTADFVNLESLSPDTQLNTSNFCTSDEFVAHKSPILLKLTNFRFEVFPTPEALRKDMMTPFSPPTHVCHPSKLNVTSNSQIIHDILAQATGGTSWSTYLLNLIILLTSCFIMFGIIVGIIKLHKRYKQNKTVVVKT